MSMKHDFNFLGKFGSCSAIDLDNDIFKPEKYFCKKSGYNYYSYLPLHLSPGGEVEFSVDSEGHSNIESSESPHEQITVTMETPLVKVWGVSTDRVTYNVYITESSGLIDIPTHGILG